jgi:L,D-peptidoglycan transpeptidase YkuD (ErfK/YbiS/YcfS/YnhG family)
MIYRSGKFVALGLFLSAYASLFIGCSETVPSGLLESVESIDRDLVVLRAAEMSPDDYARFVHQWVALKARAEAEEDAIHWPWEQNDLQQALQRLEEEGLRTVARLSERRESLRRSAQEQLIQVQDRFQLLTSRVGTIDSRLVLGQKPVETDLWITQARSFYQQGQYEQSLHASEQAAQRIAEQALVLSRELGRYADRQRITRWQEMARDTVEWSRKHQASAIVVSKADRLLTLYRNGKRVLSYPVRLGFNGIREKLYQGDGATPEGRYRVTGKRGQGQTQFYRALVLNYPNAEDRKRFLLGRKTGHIPLARSIGGQIEIHGIDNELMAQTLGCIMLDNSQMALLFTHVEKGTPVTIVGALQKDNSVALALADLSVRANEI